MKNIHNETRSSSQALNGSKQMSFLPEPDFNPIYPSMNSLEGRLLKRLLNGDSFTHPEWENETGSWRCAATKEALLKKGWPIASLNIPAPTKEAPHRHICRYYIPRSIIKRLIKTRGVL